jgi:hypothetical protein
VCAFHACLVMTPDYRVAPDDSFTPLEICCKA